MRLRWTTPALRDLAAVGDYISRENSAEAAARIVSEIFERADTLATFPQIGRPGRIPDTRELIVTGTFFIVPYRVLDGAVEILSVFHGARKWPEKFD